MKILTKNPSQTKKAGEFLAKEISKTNFRKSIVLALVGDLGGGKTTFVKGLAKGFGIKEKILSPTFVILKRFKISGSMFQNFYHIDCYRLQKPKEILPLGFKKIVSNPRNFVVIEWAEKLKKILPKKVFKINFKFVGKNIRQIEFHG